MWGYSFLFVTLINLCSLLGATVLPCMNLKIYKVVLMFLVALAVGTLVGSGLLILIPEVRITITITLLLLLLLMMMMMMMMIMVMVVEISIVNELQ